VDELHTGFADHEEELFGGASAAYRPYRGAHAGRARDLKAGVSIGQGFGRSLSGRSSGSRRTWLSRDLGDGSFFGGLDREPLGGGHGSGLGSGRSHASGWGGSYDPYKQGIGFGGQSFGSGWDDDSWHGLHDSWHGLLDSLKDLDFDAGFGGLGSQWNTPAPRSWSSWEGSYGGHYYGGYDSWSSPYSAQWNGLRLEFKNRTRALKSALRRRRTSKGTREAAADAAWRIPRVLHQTWKTSRVPAKMMEYMASWRRLHPDWTFEFWDDARNRELVNTHFPQYLADYERMSGIKRADVARIVMLYVQGGVYADIDVQAVRPLDELLEAAEDARAGVLLGEENFVHAVLLEKRESTWLVSNAVMASARQHPIWLQALREIFDNSWCGDDPVQCTGPRLIDRLSWNYLRRTPACGVHGCLVRLPFAYFSPNIARWNANNMVKQCTDQVRAYPYDYRVVSRRTARLRDHACRRSTGRRPSQCTTGSAAGAARTAP